MSQARIIPIVMPKWGLSMTEGKLGKWLKQAGDRISVGDEILEVETDKIANVVEAGDAGTLRRIVGTPDTVYSVKALLAVLAEDEVSEAEIDAYVAGYAAPVSAADGEDAVADRDLKLNLPDARIRYVKEGAGERAIILVHGFGGDADNWLFTSGALTENATVYALDLPGHGQSTKTLPDASLAGLAGTVVAFMDALGLAKADLVGHSMGGATILQVAVQHPERVRSLALICPAGLGPEINGDYIDGFIRVNSRKDLKVVLQTLFVDPDLVGRRMVDDLLSFKRLDGVQDALTHLSRNLFPGGRQGTIFRPVLESLAVPVLVVWGADDRVIPADHGLGLPAAVRSRAVAGAGHMVQMEKATAVNDLLREHLAASVQGR